jgi:hypothetical protein
MLVRNKTHDWEVYGQTWVCQALINALIGNVGASTKMSGYPTSVVSEAEAASGPLLSQRSAKSF